MYGETLCWPAYCYVQLPYCQLSDLCHFSAFRQTNAKADAAAAALLYEHVRLAKHQYRPPAPLPYCCAYPLPPPPTAPLYGSYGAAAGAPPLL